MSLDSLLAIGTRANSLASAVADRGSTAAIGSTSGQLAVGGTSGQVDSLQREGTTGGFGLSKDDFLKLFLAQMENQDPSAPMDNNQMLAQLSNMSMVETLQELSKSMAGQQLAQSSSLIGKEITGVDVDGKSVVGIVDRVVQSSDAGLVLMVGQQAVTPGNVLIVNEPTTNAGSGSSGGSGSGSSGGSGA